MIAEVYDALIDAGAKDDKARAAAVAVADFKTDINDIKNTMTDIKGRITLIQWMIALVIIVQIIPLLRNLFA